MVAVFIPDPVQARVIVFLGDSHDFDLSPRVADFHKTGNPWVEGKLKKVSLSQPEQKSPLCSVSTFSLFGRTIL